MKPVFVLNNVSVLYEMDARNSLSAGNLLRRLVLGKTPRYHCALSEINLSIEQGEIVGIGGPNGAGKSTLLRVLAGVIHPTSGTMTSREDLRVFPMLSLGVGFFPELTGRENCYLSGTILGMQRSEIDARVESIKEFSGVGKFFDEQVKKYSSGMYARLAFSLASSIEPDVLLLDEVLGVGDAEFSEKSAHRLKEMIHSGITVVLVSHNMDFMRQNCTRVLRIENGNLITGEQHEQSE